MKREDLIAAVLTDPYAHMLMHMWTDAYAQGYEDALRDHSLENTMAFPDRRRAAAEMLAERQAESTVALARIGAMLSGAHDLP